MGLPGVFCAKMCVVLGLPRNRLGQFFTCKCSF